MNKLTQAINYFTPSFMKRSSNPGGGIFGTIGRSSMIINSGKGFIPLDGNGKTLNFNEDSLNGNAKWIGLEHVSMQMFAYRYCSPLAGVIERLAEADTNGKLEFRDEDDNTVRNVSKSPKLLRIKKLMNNPNKEQTREDFNAEQLVLAKICGYCPVFCIGPTGMDKSYTQYMFNLDPTLVTPTRNENFSLFGNKTIIQANDKGELVEVWDGIDRENRIKDWAFTIGGTTYHIPNSAIILVRDGIINQQHNDLGLPLSKVAGLDFNISNINAAMEADNVLLKKKGPLGVFSGDSKPDIAGMTPMPPKEQDDLQAQLKQYGLTVEQLQFVISRWPIKWNPISFNARDLMTKETARMGIDCICDRFGYPAELMSGKNATYENRSSSEKFLYQNNIIPFSLRRMARYNKFFGLEEVKMYLDYSHLPILQEDIVKAGEAYKAESEGLLIDWESGQITWNQWQEMKGRDKVEGMDIYYPEYIKKFPNMDKQKPKKDGNNKSKARSKDTAVPKA